MSEYIVVTNELLTELQENVSKLMNEGWTLAGGISMVYKHEHTEHVHGHIIYAQAMYK